MPKRTSLKFGERSDLSVAVQKASGCLSKLLHNSDLGKKTVSASCTGSGSPPI